MTEIWLFAHLHYLWDENRQLYDAPTQSMQSIFPLLYQSGYFTIKAYNRLIRSYTLDVPNNKVRIGLVRSMVPYYVARDTLTTNNTVAEMTLALYTLPVNKVGINFSSDTHTIADWTIEN